MVLFGDMVTWRGGIVGSRVFQGLGISFHDHKFLGLLHTWAITIVSDLILFSSANVIVPHPTLDESDSVSVAEYSSSEEDIPSNDG